MISGYVLEGPHATDPSLHALKYTLFILSCDMLAIYEII